MPAAQHHPELSQAVAGRDRARLRALGLDVPVIVASTDDDAALDRLAGSATVVLNMAGPLRRIGDPIVRAWVRNGGTVASIVEGRAAGDAVREGDPSLLGPGDRSPRPAELDPSGLRFNRSRKAWLAASPTGVADSRAVRRSAELRGRDFEFTDYLAFDGSRSRRPSSCPGNGRWPGGISPCCASGSVGAC